LDYLHPLSDDLQVVLQVDVFQNATGQVGFSNTGWWGIGVQPETYNASFYMLPNEPRYKKNLTHIDVSLRSDITGTVFATSSIPVNPNVTTHDYTQYAGLIHNTQQAPNGNNSFFLTMDAREVAGQTFFFDLVSLFGETYKGRKNGLRKDLAQDLADLKPKFLRFPGGNNLEGYSQFRRWKWWKTIGPLT
jgi:alpha-N-arabinofuranosidase